MAITNKVHQPFFAQISENLFNINNYSKKDNSSDVFDSIYALRCEHKWGREQLNWGRTALFERLERLLYHVPRFRNERK